ncbi:hypothetical protein A4C45_13255 [Escherichia coli O157:H7]|nr:hypothetical protein A4C45_13255 [Escherichia coli O157:H7]
MLPSETMIWQPEFTDKTLSRKPGAVQISWKKLTANCLLSRKQKKKMMKKNRNHLAQWQNDNQKKSGKRPFYSTKNTGGNQSCDSPY